MRASESANSSVFKVCCPSPKWALLLLFGAQVAVAVGVGQLDVKQHNVTAFSRYIPKRTSFKKGTNYQAVKARFGGKAYSADAVAQLPLCNLDGGTALQKGSWLLHKATGQYFFEPKDCRLRRHTHKEVLSCLAGKRISFVGDSVSRQHFTTFVTWVATGYLPNPYDDGVFSPTNAHLMPTWNHYFEELSRRVQRGLPKNTPGPRPAISFVLRLPRNVTDIKAKRMQLAMHGVMPGNSSIFIDYCFAGMTPSWLEAGLGGLSSLYNGDVPQPPDVVVFNMAAWWFLTNKSEKTLYKEMGQMFQHAKLLSEQHGNNTTLLWRTAMLKNWGSKNRQLSSLARKQNWQVLDTTALTKAMRKQKLWLNMRRTDNGMDELHFLPVVYEQMVDILLARICSA